MRRTVIALALIAVAAPAWAGTKSPFATSVEEMNAPQLTHEQKLQQIRSCIARNNGRLNPFCMPQGATSQDIQEVLKE